MNQRSSRGLEQNGERRTEADPTGVKGRILNVDSEWEILQCCSANEVGNFLVEVQLKKR